MERMKNEQLMKEADLAADEVTQLKVWSNA